MALGICVLALLVLVLILVIACPGGEKATVTTTTGSETATTLVSGTYTAELTGAESVPPVETAAAATLTLTYDAETEKLTYELRVTSPLTNPSVAAIYEGAPGTDGTAVYTLFAGPTKTGTFTGLLPDETTDNTIIDADLVGTLSGKTVADLIALIKEGNAYVSIGNESHPVDAIRGQITD
jgi:hypothetical protein